MAIKLFTNAVKEHEGESVGINPHHVVNVYERKYTVAKDDGNEEVSITYIYCGCGTWEVKESFVTVIARLNERD